MHYSNKAKRFSAILTAAVLASGVSGNFVYADASYDNSISSKISYDGSENEESAAYYAEEAGEQYSDISSSVSSDAENEVPETYSTESASEDEDRERPVKAYDPVLESDADSDDDLAGASSLNTSSWTKYSLTDAQLLAITRLCYQEQGSVAGAAAEASLMANLLELYHTASYGTSGTSLYNYVRNGKWFANAAKFMDSGSLPSNAGDYINAVRNVLVNGKRTLPLYIDEHDCLSDISQITGTASDGSFVSGQTVISNKFGSTYTFYSYPAKGSDPFGYTNTAVRLTGMKTPAVYSYDTASNKSESSGSSSASAPVYRLYNRNSGEHFYTKSAKERDNLIKAGWKNENIAWYAHEDGGSDVYRLYSKNTGDHFYTVSAKERDALVKSGWKYEGVAWQSCPDSDHIPLYRLYNPQAKGAGSHHYTTSTKERDTLVKAGWRDESIAWYSCS